MKEFIFLYVICIVIRIIAGKTIYGKNILNEKKSIYYQFSAEAAEKSYEQDRWIFIYIPDIVIFLELLISIVFNCYVKYVGYVSLIGTMIVLSSMLIIYIMLILYFIGIYKRKNANVVIERDCDIEKGQKILELRLNKMPSRFFLAKKRKAVWMVEMAHCYILSEDMEWEAKAEKILQEVENYYPKIVFSTGYINVRLKMYARKNDVAGIENCLKLLEEENKKFLKRFNPTGLIEEAKIHKYFVMKEYDSAEEMIKKHFKRGDCVLALVYMHYYLAIIASSKGNTEEAGPHVDYVKNNGGNTYYLNQLKGIQLRDGNI